MAFTIATTNSEAAWRPDHFTFAPGDVIPNALILQCSTPAGEIQGDEPAVRVAFVDDDDADYVSEGSPIPEGQPTLSEALIYTGRISKLLRVTEEAYRQPGTPNQLAASAARAIVYRADTAFLTEPAPTPPANGPSTGLLNVPEIVDGGVVTTNLDALVDLVAQLQINLAVPTHLVIGPLGWAELRKFKQADALNNVSLLGAGTTDAQQLLLSLPVVVNNAITDYGGLVLDRRAIVSATGQVEVATSIDAYFQTMDVGLRTVWRIGFTVPRPDRLGKFQIVPEGS